MGIVNTSTRWKPLSHLSIECSKSGTCNLDILAKRYLERPSVKASDDERTLTKEEGNLCVK